MFLQHYSKFMKNQIWSNVVPFEMRIKHENIINIINIKRYEVLIIKFCNYVIDVNN